MLQNIPSVTFGGKEYPLRTILNSQRYEVVFGTTSLAGVLMPDELDGECVNQEAENIDYQIAGYVSDEEITLSDKKLAKVVRRDLYDGEF